MTRLPETAGTRLRLTAALTLMIAGTLALFVPAGAVAGIDGTTIPLKDAHHGQSWEHFDHEDCDEVELAPGQYLWHFTMGPMGPNTPGQHELHWNGVTAGVATGHNVHFTVINTESIVPGTVYAITTNAGDKTELRVSHTCSGGGQPTTTTTSTTTTTEPTTTTSSTTSTTSSTTTTTEPTTTTTTSTTSTTTTTEPTTTTTTSTTEATTTTVAPTTTEATTTTTTSTTSTTEATTTTVAPTTTEATTTTTEATTTTAVSPTSVLASTTVVDNTTAAPTTNPAAQSAQVLAFTGNNSSLTVPLGIAMIGAGALLIALERRRTRPRS